jgi:CheY-like chemotaxis protein
VAENKKKILTIDDEPDERLYLSTLLEDNGFITAMAEDGRDGFEKAVADPPDLITLDITMPEKSGIRFYQEIRAHPRLGHVPIIIVTGVAGLDGNPEEFYNFLTTRGQTPPPDGFITKPVNQKQLLDTILDLLG